jgi:D-threo-aldose 1-dehydrogenase
MPPQSGGNAEQVMNPISKVQIGKSRLQVTRLGLGGAALGGLFRDVSKANGTRTVRRALELGINFFDTAPLYGAGKSESWMGAGLAGRDRNSYVLASKVGYDLVPQDRGSKDIYFPFENPPSLRPIVDLSYEAVMRSFEGSLKRLDIGRIDILHIHDPDDLFDVAMQDAYVALERLRREGIIGAVSVGTNRAETVVRFAKAGNFDCFLLAGRYTLLDHGALVEALPLCLRKGVSIIIGGPYNSGILASGAVPGAMYNYVPADAEILRKVRQIEDICRKYSVPLKAAALQFPLAHPAVASVVPGARTEDEVEENFQAVSFRIPDEFWSDLRSNKILPQEAPVPTRDREAESRAGSGDS